MLPTRLLTAGLFLASVSALNPSIDEDVEGLQPKKAPNPSKRRGNCVANERNGICVVLDRNVVKKIPCGSDTRKCTGATRRPCAWHSGFADCT